MKYIVALDLEGIHGVVGKPYEGLNSEDYQQATTNAVKEINALCEELFSAGETEVLLWDNHGGTDNIDASKLKGNVSLANWRKYPYRMQFLKDYDCVGIFFLGYHARAGSLGVLAHTYSSKDVQYYKINGKQVGEFEIDSIIASQYGVVPYFSASDDVAIEQMKELCPDLNCAVTKIAKGRNEAEIFDADKVLKEIKEQVKISLRQKHQPVKVQFPMQVEVRFTRLERACMVKSNLEKVLKNGVVFGEDCHTIQTTLENVRELEILLRGEVAPD